MIKKMFGVLFGISLVAFWFPTSLMAQVNIIADTEYIISLGKLRDNYQYGLGGSLGVRYRASKNIDLFLKAGYTHIKGVHIEDQYLRYFIPNLSAVPLSVGIKVNTGFLFFIQASAGSLWIVDPNKRLGWQYAGGGGIRYKHFELSGRLMQWNNGGIINFAGLQLAYSL